jgi:hypothetical protein
MSEPVITYWSSLAPSKLVKIVNQRAVSAGQWHVDPPWYQHGPLEGNDDFRPVRTRTQPQVHRRYIPALTCHYRVGQASARAASGAGGPHTGRCPRDARKSRTGRTLPYSRRECRGPLACDTPGEIIPACVGSRFQDVGVMPSRLTWFRATAE